MHVEDSILLEPYLYSGFDGQSRLSRAGPQSHVTSDNIWAFFQGPGRVGADGTADIGRRGHIEFELVAPQAGIEAVAGLDPPCVWTVFETCRGRDRTARARAQVSAGIPTLENDSRRPGDENLVLCRLGNGLPGVRGIHRDFSPLGREEDWGNWKIPREFSFYAPEAEPVAIALSERSHVETRRERSRASRFRAQAGGWVPALKRGTCRSFDVHVVLSSLGNGLPGKGGICQNPIPGGRNENGRVRRVAYREAHCIAPGTCAGVIASLNPPSVIAVVETRREHRRACRLRAHL